MALGQDVPEELWMAVAEVLVWAYGLEGQAAAGR
jgi:type III secretion system FlhB-like substrate exporter